MEVFIIIISISLLLLIGICFVSNDSSIVFENNNIYNSSAYRGGKNKINFRN